MAVTNAFWGRISDKVCPSDDGDPVTDCDASPDTLQKVKGYCEGKKECDLMAKHEYVYINVHLSEEWSLIPAVYIIKIICYLISVMQQRNAIKE